MTELEYSQLLRRPESAYDRRYALVTASCAVEVINYPPDLRAIDLRFSMTAGGGYSDLRWRIDVRDLPALLTAVGDLAGGPRILADAAAAAVGREQERLRDAVLEFANSFDRARALVDTKGVDATLEDLQYEVESGVSDLLEPEPPAAELRLL